MSNWHAAKWACPQCGEATQGRAGPDHILALRCQECEWSASYELGLGDRPKDDLVPLHPDA